MKMNAFLEKLQDTEVVSAIRHAEGRTSGEIRVFISRSATQDPVKAAGLQFERLGMTRTEERNGVLVYLAPESRRFAIIGDKGIHERCGEAFWHEVAEEMGKEFRDGQFTRGLVHGIHRAGELLARHFPRQPDDRNELPDAVERD